MTTSTDVAPEPIDCRTAVQRLWDYLDRELDAGDAFVLVGAQSRFQGLEVAGQVVAQVVLEGELFGQAGAGDAGLGGAETGQ